MIIAARFILPVCQPPVENGAVQFDNGVITAVGKRSEISRRSGEGLIDYGDAIILPGLVNAHTHLELTGLAGQVPPTPDLPGWLSRLMRHFSEHPPTPESVTAAVREGIRQSLADGVTTVGDITRFPSWSRPVLADSALHCVSFGEVIAIGARRGLLGRRLEAAMCAEASRANGQNEPSPLPKGGQRGVRFGISPHSPYTVEESALKQCAAEAAKLQLPICVHAAESREEVEFVRTGRGPMRDFLESIGVWDERIPVPGCGPIELLHRTGLLTPRTVLAHCNYVSDEDLGLIAQSGASVVYCPRTHAAFGHPPHRFMDMLAAGINVCLGTDSRASNPSLSILEEIQFLCGNLPDVSPETMLMLAARNGAAALLRESGGIIRCGTSMDAVVLGADAGSGWQAALAVRAPVRAAFCAGRPTCSAGRSMAQP